MVFLLFLICSSWATWNYEVVKHHVRWFQNHVDVNCMQSSEFQQSLKNTLKKIGDKEIKIQCGETGSSSTSYDHGWVLCECLILWNEQINLC